MKNIVYVGLKDGIVSVENESFPIKNLSADLIKKYLPENIEPADIGGISWCLNDPTQTVFNTYHNGDFRFDVAEENYNKFIKPYVDIWQAKQDEQQQEQEKAKVEWNKFENRQARAIEVIRADYARAQSDGFMRSSLGFDADISPSSTATLLGTQTNLVATQSTKSTETPTTAFFDFNGYRHDLDADQVQVLICEINYAQNHLRVQKHRFKTAVTATTDNESLNTCLATCLFTALDFSRAAEDGTPAELPIEQPKTIQERVDAR